MDLPSEVRLGATDAGSHGVDVEPVYTGSPLSPIEAAERQALVKAIRDTEGNMAKAATLLQVSRSTLYRRCRRLNIPHRGL